MGKSKHLSFPFVNFPFWMSMFLLLLLTLFPPHPHPHLFRQRIRLVTELVLSTSNMTGYTIVEQDLFTLPKYLRSPFIVGGVSCCSYEVASFQGYYVCEFIGLVFNFLFFMLHLIETLYKNDQQDHILKKLHCWSRLTIPYWSHCPLIDYFYHYLRFCLHV